MKKTRKIKIYTGYEECTTLSELIGWANDAILECDDNGELSYYYCFAGNLASFEATLNYTAEDKRCDIATKRIEYVINEIEKISNKVDESERLRFECFIVFIYLLSKYNNYDKSEVFKRLSNVRDSVTSDTEFYQLVESVFILLKLNNISDSLSNNEWSYSVITYINKLYCKEYDYKFIDSIDMLSIDDEYLNFDDVVETVGARELFKSLAAQTKSLEQANKEILRQQRQIEVMMSDITHNFGTYLRIINKNRSNPVRVGIAIERLSLLYDFFKLLSLEPQTLIDRLRKDPAGDGSVLDVLSECLKAKCYDAINPDGRDVIVQHYYNYARRYDMVASGVSLEDWYANSILQHKELNKAWLESFTAAQVNNNLQDLRSWFEAHFFKLKLEGFDNRNIKISSVRHTLLFIVIGEFLLNAIRYCDPQDMVPTVLSLAQDGSKFVIKCSNPTSSSIMESKGGDSLGHRFLHFIAERINGRFETSLCSNLYTASFEISTSLLISEA
jgi:hypothetical protein